MNGVDDSDGVDGADVNVDNLGGIVGDAMADDSDSSDLGFLADNLKGISHIIGGIAEDGSARDDNGEGVDGLCDITVEVRGLTFFL